MSSKKKIADPSDAALLAIEEALGMGESTSKTGASEKTVLVLDPPAGASGALPKVEAFDALGTGSAPSPRNDGLTASRETPKALEAEMPFKRTPPRAPASTKPENDAADLTPRMEALDEAQAIPQSPRRNSVVPANDDRRSSVADLLEPLRRPASMMPHVFAVLLSMLWIAGAWLVLARPDGLLLAADSTLRPNNEGQLILIGMGVVLPVLFFFILAALQRRAREMRTTSRVMAEIAARLAEPEVSGSETVFTLGQAVRREVSSIGDGIERAVSRASELESLVHGEVSALERSYADNEYKMRALVTELSSEREAIMATAERIRLSIDAAHQGFSSDISKASSNIGTAIEEAGSRVTFLIGGKQDELVSTLDRTATHTSELISLRTNELAERLASVNQTTAATIQDQATRATQEIEAAGLRTSEALQSASQSLVSEWQMATTHSGEQITLASETSARLIRDAAEGSSSNFRTVSEEATMAFRQSAESATIQLQDTATETSKTIAQSAESATNQLQETARDTGRTIAQSAEAASTAFQQVGTSLKSEIEETAGIVTSAFNENGRSIIDTIGTRAIELGETMRDASTNFITTISERGEHIATQLEERGTTVAQNILARGEDLSGKITLSATAIENTLGENTRIIEARLDAGTGRLADLLGAHADGMSRALSEVSERIDETVSGNLGKLGQQIEQANIDIESTLRVQTGQLEQSLIDRGVAMAELISVRIEQANEAFSIAGESLGGLITTRTGEATTGLKAEIDSLGLALAQQASAATERLAGAGRDVVQAMNVHGTKVNEALASNAIKLSESVNAHSLDLSDKMAQFEKTFSSETSRIEQSIMLQSDAVTERLSARSGDIANTLDRLVSRIEEGIDDRAKGLGDALALRTLEFSRIVGDTGGTLLGDLDSRVAMFSAKVVDPLDAHIAALQNKTDQAANQIGARIDQSADAILVRASEVERALTSLSRDVGSELMTRAEQINSGLSGKIEEISSLFDNKGTSFVANFDTRGRELVAGLETATQALTTRVTASLEELNTAIISGSETSLSGLVEANDKLRTEVANLLGRLGDANRLLNGIVGTATESLTEVEGRMSERVQGLEATLAAILSAANEGSDALAQKVEAIRSASGDVLLHSQGITQELGVRTGALQSLAQDLGSTQQNVNRLLGERQEAFEALNATLGGRIEDMDSMLRSFTALVDEHLTEAQTKARDASALVHESAQSSAEAIGMQFDRVRLETGKERERTAAALRSAYDQANGEMSTLFQRTMEGFASTATQLRQASQDIMRELEATRAAVQLGGLEIPREARDAAANLKRVVSDQMRALNELGEIVSRSNPALDVAEPRREARLPEPEAPRAAPVLRPALRSTTTPPSAMRPGGSWLSGLLERASDEPEAPLASRATRQPDPSSASRIESLDSLSVDIARMIDHEAAVELWDRYRKGERNVFTRRLYTLQGAEAYDDIRRRYRRDTEFRKTVDAYTDQFERLLTEVAGDDRDSLVARTYLTSDTGKVYTMLAHASGRFD